MSEFKVSPKEANIASASEKKKANVAWKTGDLNVAGITDADNIGPKQRLAYDDFSKGYSLDAFETHKDSDWLNTERNKKKIEKQRRAAAYVLDKAIADTTNEDIFKLGQDAKQKLLDAAYKGQENFFTDGTTAGPVRPSDTESGMPQVDILNMGPDPYYPQRDLVQARNPVTGEVLADAVNTPEVNASYHSRFNKLKKELDTVKAAEEKAALISDPNAVMSDEFAQTDTGKAINVGGAVVSGAGKLVNTITDAPKELATASSHAIDTLKGDIKKYAPETSDAVSKAYKGSFAEKIVETVKYDINVVTDTLDTIGDWYSETWDLYFHKGNQQKIQKELGDDYDNNEGFVDVTKAMIETAADNPVAAAETFIQSLPEMMSLSKKGVVGSAAFVAIVGDRIAAATETFEKEHGRKPNPDEYAKMVGAGVLATGIDKVEADFILGPLGKIKPVKEIADKVTKFPKNNKAITALKEATEVITKNKAVTTLQKIPGTKTVAKGTASAVTEPFQEGTQTYLEEIAGKQTEESLTSPETLKNTAVAAGQGIGAGAVGGGGVQALADTAVATGNVVKGTKKVVEKVKEDAAKGKALNTEEIIKPEKVTSDNRAEEINKTHKNLDTLMAQYQEETDPAKKKDIETQVRKAMADVDAITNAGKETNKETVTKSTENIASATTPQEVTPEDVNAIVDDIAYGSENISSFTALAENENTPPKLKEAIIAAKEMDIAVQKYKAKTSEQVQGEVLGGGINKQGHKGLKAHNAAIGNAIASGNQEVTNSSIEELEKFLSSQRTKYAEIRKMPLNEAVKISSGITYKFETQEAKDNFLAPVVEEGKLLAASVKMNKALAAQKFDSTSETITEQAAETTTTETPTVAPPETTQAETTTVEPVSKQKEESSEITDKVMKEPPPVDKIRPPEKETLSVKEQISSILSGLNEEALPVGVKNNLKNGTRSDLVLGWLNKHAADPKLQKTVEKAVTETTPVVESETTTETTEEVSDLETNAQSLLDNSSIPAVERDELSNLQDELVAIKANKEALGSQYENQLNNTLNNLEVAYENAQEVAVDLGNKPTKSTNKTETKTTQIGHGFTEVVSTEESNTPTKETPKQEQAESVQEKTAETTTEQQPEVASEKLPTVNENLLDNSIETSAQDKFGKNYTSSEIDSKTGFQYKKYLIKSQSTDSAVVKTLKTVRDLLRPNKKVASSILGRFNNAFSYFQDTDKFKQLAAEYELTKEEQENLVGLITFEAEFKDTFNDLLKPFQDEDGSSNLFKEDLEKDVLNLLRDKDGNMPDNVISAMAMSAMNWLGTRGSETLFNDDTAINMLIGANPEDNVSFATASALRGVGSLKNNVAASLGKEIKNQINLTGKKGINGAFEAKLELSLGHMALATLIDNGFIHQARAKNGDLDQFRSADNQSKDPETAINFITIDKDFTDDNSRFIPSEQVQDIIDNMKGNKELFNKLFGVESHKVVPTDKPVTDVVDKMQRTINDVSASVKKSIKKAQAVPFQAHENVMDVFNKIDEKTFLEALGYTYDMDSVHVTEEDSVRGKNTAIKREYDAVKEFMAEREKDKPFYFTYSIWKNLRAGVTSNTVNLQGSKLHRFLFGAKAWTSEIRLDDTSHTKAMQLAIAEAFDMDVDKTVDGTIFENFAEQVMESDGTVNKTYAAAVDILSSDKKIFTSEEQKVLTEAMAAGGAKTHTLAGLVALAAYSQAIKNGDESFTTNLPRETDGITNGVISGLIQMAPDITQTKEQLNRGGVFFKDQMYPTYSNWISQSAHNDSYQSLTVEVNKKLPDARNSVQQLVSSPTEKDLMSPTKTKVIKAFRDSKTPLSQIFTAIENNMTQFVDKEGKVTKAGRTFSKEPLMITAYGAGIKKIKETVGLAAVKDFYSSLMLKHTDPAAYKESVKNVGTILGIKDLEAQIEAKGQREFKLNNKQEENLSTIVSAYYGNALEEGLNTQLSGFSDNRQQVNNAVRLMSEVFRVKYDAAIEAATKDKGDILSQDEINDVMIELRDQGFLPGFLHATSEAFNDSLQVMKTEDQTVSEEDGGKIDQRYNKELRVDDITFDGANTSYKKGATVKQSSGNIKQKVPMANPGVIPFLTGNISIDANVNAFLMGKLDMLNVFDAGVYNLLDTPSSTHLANETYSRIHNEWTMIDEVKTSLNRFMKEFNKLSEADQKAINKNVRNEKTGIKTAEKKPVASVEEAVAIFDVTHKKVTTNKKILLADIAMMEQFANDGSGYMSDLSQNTTRAQTKKAIDKEVDNFINEPPIYFSEQPSENEQSDQTAGNLQQKAQAARTIEQLGPSFRRWFGASLSINEDGTPTRFFYQGKRPNKQEFKQEELGGSTGEAFASLGFFASTKPEKHYGPYTSEMYVRAENPMFFKNGKEFNDWAEAAGYEYSSAGFKQAREYLQTIGHDSVYFEDNGWVVVFDGNQFKATENTGEYSREDNTIYGSSSANPAFNQFQSTYSGMLNADAAAQIFSDMAGMGTKKASPEHQAHLNNLVENLIKPAMREVDRFNIDMQVNEQGTKSRGAIQGTNIYVEANSGIIGNNAEMSTQEVAVHEWLHAILETGINGNHYARKELDRLFKIAKKVVTPEDFLTRDAEGNIVITSDYAADFVAAQARYDHIFNNPDGHQLHEFATLALSNQQFMTALGKVDNKRTPKAYDNSIVDKVLEVLTRIIDWMGGKIYGSQGKTVDQAMMSLSQNIAGINNSKKYQILNQMDNMHHFNTLAAQNITEYVIQPYVRYVDSRAGVEANIVRKRLDTIIGLPKNLADHKFQKALADTMYGLGFTKDNFVYKLILEVTNPVRNIPYQDLLRKAKHVIDSTRERMSNLYANDILKAFDPNNPLDETELLQLTNGLLKTDLISLFDSGNYSVQDIVDLFRNNVDVNINIRRVKKELEAFKGSKIGKKEYDLTIYYGDQAESLGHFMAQGKALMHGQMMNAHNIANLHTVVGMIPPKNSAKAEALIDELASLYAIRYSVKQTNEATANRIESEYKNNSEENGITYLLNAHREFKSESLKHNFNGDKSLTTKGYTVESLDPAISFVTGTPAQEKYYNAQGYVRQPGSVNKDPLDIDGPKDLVMYVAKDGLMNKYMTGITSLLDKQNKGSTLTKSYEQSGQANPDVLAKSANARITKSVDKMIGKQFAGQSQLADPTNNFVIPIVNSTGGITDYRYVMSEVNKNTLLNKQDFVHETMGKMLAGIDVKTKTKEVNAELVKLIKKDYDENYVGNEREFVKVGLKSKNEKHAETYKLLPKDMKREFEKEFAAEHFYVRQEIYDTAFGFRKFSAVKYLSTKVDIPVNMQHVMRIAENIMQAMVTTAKRNIVLLTPDVIIGNIVSNIILSVVSGASPVYVIKKQAEAVSALKQYKDTLSKRDSLKFKLKTTPNLANKKKMEAQIAGLDADLKNNPIADLVDAGLFQSIVEDLAIHDVDTRDKIIKAIPGAANIAVKAGEHIPGFVTNTYKQLIMDPSTKTGAFLGAATQYSDFVARYAMYEYYTKERGLKSEDAMHKVIDMFINYDVPTSPGMQYLNDIGILMFTKFLFRIQRIILKTFIDNPINSAAWAVFDSAIYDAPDIVDSNIISTFGLGRLRSPAENIDDAFTFNALNWVPGL